MGNQATTNCVVDTSPASLTDRVSSLLSNDAAASSTLASVHTPKCSCSGCAQDVYPSFLYVPSLGQETVPILFIWPFGGDHVFLTGSFNNWSFKILMDKHVASSSLHKESGLPSQSSDALPTSQSQFMLLLDLVPGTYEYRFIVDGKWRHCPDCPTVTSLQGLVNNLIEVRRPSVEGHESKNEQNSCDLLHSPTDSPQTTPKQTASPLQSEERTLLEASCVCMVATSCLTMPVHTTPVPAWLVSCPRGSPLKTSLGFGVGSSFPTKILVQGCAR